MVYSDKSAIAPSSGNILPSTHTITFGGHALLLDASGALYWPEARILVVSDMHLEKSTFLAAHGSLIPPYDTLDTLLSLQRLITIYQPRELLLLGDSFHDAYAWVRLDASLPEKIAEIVSLVEQCSWIEGNHDSTLHHSPLQGFYVERDISGLLFRHEHRPTEQAQIIGHYHPKASITLHRSRVRGPCFAYTDSLLIMPAFGSYTGGLDITHEVYAPLANGQRWRLHLLYKQGIYKL